ncbi:MAG: DNA repair protein RadA, partial [Candidatus Hydrogenedentes bacterium]|nr:DNA repair protein RadA [Candidatus Hydrogenedentota bacterium]
MSKAKSTFVCQSCGAISVRWSGRCDACGEWNTIVEEEVVESGKHTRQSFKEQAAAPIPITDSAQGVSTRLDIQLAECNRVMGGGIVPGSLT